MEYIIFWIHLRCPECNELAATLDEVADTKQNQDYGILVAKIDCSNQTELCEGKQVVFVMFRDVSLSILIAFNIHKFNTKYSI